MNVNIDENFREFIEQKIKSGEYVSVNEVVEAALNRLATDDFEFAPGELDALVKPALDQVRRGEVFTDEEVTQRLETHQKQFLAKRLGA